MHSTLHLEDSDVPQDEPCFEWVRDCYLAQGETFFNYIMARKVTYQWVDDVRSVLDQLVLLDFYSANSL